MWNLTIIRDRLKIGPFKVPVQQINSCRASPQGTPMKQEAAVSGKRHDVRSIIASSPRSYHNTPSHLERGRYEEAPKGRPSAVVSTASPIARSSPLTLGSEQGGKAHHSPVGYDDKGSLRTPYPGPSHRGSPLSREASQRQHDGGYTSYSRDRCFCLFLSETRAWFALYPYLNKLCETHELWIMGTWIIKPKYHVIRYSTP